jgi:hypothetical protein
MGCSPKTGLPIAPGDMIIAADTVLHEVNGEAEDRPEIIKLLCNCANPVLLVNPDSSFESLDSVS